jgi:hypothetical protein
MQTNDPVTKVALAQSARRELEAWGGPCLGVARASAAGASASNGHELPIIDDRVRAACKA